MRQQNDKIKDNLKKSKYKIVEEWMLSREKTGYNENECEKLRFQLLSLFVDQAEVLTIFISDWTKPQSGVYRIPAMHLIQTTLDYLLTLEEMIELSAVPYDSFDRMALGAEMMMSSNQNIVTEESIKIKKIIENTCHIKSTHKPIWSVSLANVAKRDEYFFFRSLSSAESVDTARRLDRSQIQCSKVDGKPIVSIDGVFSELELDNFRKVVESKEKAKLAKITFERGGVLQGFSAVETQKLLHRPPALMQILFKLLGHLADELKMKISTHPSSGNSANILANFFPPRHWGDNKFTDNHDETNECEQLVHTDYSTLATDFRLVNVYNEGEYYPDSFENGEEGRPLFVTLLFRIASKEFNAIRDGMNTVVVDKDKKKSIHQLKQGEIMLFLGDIPHGIMPRSKTADPSIWRFSLNLPLCMYSKEGSPLNKFWGYFYNMQVKSVHRLGSKLGNDLIAKLEALKRLTNQSIDYVPAQKCFEQTKGSLPPLLSVEQLELLIYVINKIKRGDSTSVQIVSSPCSSLKTYNYSPADVLLESNNGSDVILAKIAYNNSVITVELDLDCELLFIPKCHVSLADSNIWSIYCYIKKFNSPEIKVMYKDVNHVEIIMPGFIISTPIHKPDQSKAEYIEKLRASLDHDKTKLVAVPVTSHEHAATRGAEGAALTTYPELVAAEEFVTQSILSGNNNASIGSVNDLKLITADEKPMPIFNHFEGISAVGLMTQGMFSADSNASIGPVNDLTLILADEQSTPITTNASSG